MMPGTAGPHHFFRRIGSSLNKLNKIQGQVRLIQVTSAPVWNYLFPDSPFSSKTLTLYRVSSVFFIPHFFIHFCFLSVTVLKEVHGYLGEQSVGQHILILLLVLGHLL